jgi:hypothetical protein
VKGLFDGQIEESAYGTVPRRQPTAEARHDDPESSQQAAAKMNRSGKARAHGAIVLGLVRRWPGSTAVELFHAQGGDSALDRVEVGRRLDSLVKTGQVRQGPERECTVKKVRMLTWWPNESGGNDAST